MSAGQWLETDGTRWFFDAGAESLDYAASPNFVNPADIGRWLADRFDRLNPRELTDRDLADAVALRDAIGRLAAATADDQPRARDDIDTVNLFAATPDVPPALDGGRRQAGAGRIRVGQALSSLARDAVAVLSADGARVRRCTGCGMVFRDESRTDNRRWCSMQRCGNRAKVRAHRARAARESGGRS